MLQSASANTILRTVVDDTVRGRVMAFYTTHRKAWSILKSRATA